MTGNVTQLFNDFKTDLEKHQFVEQQYKTILSLMQKNRQLTEEIEKLKKMMIETSLTSQGEVIRVIITPEEALIESQIELIRNRAFLTELTLEDVKKLDLLIKNKSIVKEQVTTIQSESRKPDKLNLSNAELIQIASKDNG